MCLWNSLSFCFFVWRTGLFFFVQLHLRITDPIIGRHHISIGLLFSLPKKGASSYETSYRFVTYCIGNNSKCIGDNSKSPVLIRNVYSDVLKRCDLSYNGPSSKCALVPFSSLPKNYPFSVDIPTLLRKEIRSYHLKKEVSRINSIRTVQRLATRSSDLEQHTHTAFCRNTIFAGPPAGIYISTYRSCRSCTF